MASAYLQTAVSVVGDTLLPRKLAQKLPHNVKKREALQEVQRERRLARSEAMIELARRWIVRKHSDILAGAIAFVPWIVQQAHSKGELGHNVVVHKGVGAVVFSDASGFTALTEKLAQKSNGAELLSQCLTAFFTPLIDIISSYRGDVIKFSGDALTIYFPADNDPDLDDNLPPCGTYGCKGHCPEELATLRASACCIEIHRRLHMFDTGVDGVKLCLHIGVGFGDVTILQVGGLVPPETTVERYEYVICGPPMEQISIAEPLASNGETCLSPEAWNLVAHTFEGTPVERKLASGETSHDFVMLGELKPELHTFPVLKQAAIETDRRKEFQFGPDQLDLCRRYIPSAVFKQIAGGTLQYVNEMRNMSVIFINVQGIDVATEDGSQQADLLMKGVQRCCNAHEGTLNKFLVDDKGMLFLLCFGLPPLVHKDDAIRAILCCMDIRKVMIKMNLTARFGVTTGRNYCGVVGSASRMEYTVLGDSVNLAARLMANAKPQGILVGERTYELAKSELDFNILEKIKVKGKTALIPIFEPRLQQPKPVLGLCPKSKKLHLPWLVQSELVGGTNKLLKVQNWREYIICQRLLDETDRPVPAASKSSGRPLADVDNIFEARAAIGLDTKHTTTIGHAQPAAEETKEFPDAAQQIERHRVFHDGGPMIVFGGFGLGKTELAEYVVHAATEKFDLLPIVGAGGVRPGELGRVFSDILRSICSIFRSTDHTFPADSDFQCLERIIKEHLVETSTSATSGYTSSPSGTKGTNAKFSYNNDVHDEQWYKKVLDWLPRVLGPPWIHDSVVAEQASKGDGKNEDEELLIIGKTLTTFEEEDDPSMHGKYEDLTSLIVALVRKLLQEKSVVVALRFERGTNLFTRTDDSTFWMVAGALLELYKELREQRYDVGSGGAGGANAGVGGVKSNPRSLGGAGAAATTNYNFGTNSTGLASSGGKNDTVNFKNNANNNKPSHNLTIVLCVRDRKTIPGYERVMQHFVKETRQTGVWLDTQGFGEKLVGEYMSIELNCPQENIPMPLVKYISDITLGNALFVREAMAMLQLYGHMQLHDKSANASGKFVTCQENLDETVEVAGWPNTFMIGSVLAVIESLDPLPASIVKMAAVFRSAWTMADILASACPPWSGQARFEALRQFLALTQLVEMDIVEPVPLVPNANSTSASSSSGGTGSQNSQKQTGLGNFISNIGHGTSSLILSSTGRGSSKERSSSKDRGSSGSQVRSSIGNVNQEVLNQVHKEDGADVLGTQREGDEENNLHGGSSAQMANVNRPAPGAAVATGDTGTTKNSSSTSQHQNNHSNTTTSAFASLHQHHDQQHSNKSAPSPKAATRGSFSLERVVHNITHPGASAGAGAGPAGEQADQHEYAGPFRLSNTLVRKVAGSMVLEAQKRGVKRQALMDRTLNRDLPARLEALRQKKAIPHIPWYYQIELPRNLVRGSSVGPLVGVDTSGMSGGNTGISDQQYNQLHMRGGGADHRGPAGGKISSKELARAQSQALLQNAEQLGAAMDQQKTLLQSA
ncbi:unnamed protein product [Amoebophrya sp. A120]|nr:unnamed protein product [Amoebophrya sp. A120]|eukprot:GSA120T00000372001.1